MAALLPTLLIVYIAERYYKLRHFSVETYSLVDALLLKISQAAFETVEGGGGANEEFTFSGMSLPENLTFLRDAKEPLISMPTKETAFVKVMSSKEAVVVDRKLTNSLQFLVQTLSLHESEEFIDISDNLLTLAMMLAGFNFIENSRIFGSFSFDNFKGARYEVQNFGEDALLLANQLVFTMFQMNICGNAAARVMELFRKMAFNENLFRLIIYAESCEVSTTLDNKFKGLLFG